MNLRLTVLGSGGIRPDPHRGGPAHLFSAGSSHLLLDAGPGASRALKRAGLQTSDLTGIAITHRHPDHMGELLLLLELERLRPRTEALALLGPGLLDEYLDFMAAWGRDEPRKLPYPVARHLMPGACELGPMRIEAMAVPHVPDSVGYRVDVGEKRMVYAGDCGPGPEVEELAQGADLLLLECSLPASGHTVAHLAPEQAAEIAVAAGAKRLLLTHFPPDYDTELAVEIAKARGLCCQAAHDGLQIEI